MLSRSLATAIASIAVPLALMGGAPNASADKPKPVTIRIVADHPPPPHPAAIAQTLFKKKIEEAIPGSDVRIFFAGSLYTVPEALEAMTEGNLEMTWGQFGKTAASDRWMNVVVGPMLLTTVGAMEQMDKFESVKMLVERFSKQHGVKVFGTGHLSLYIGVGGKQRLRTPEDFKGKKIRSFGPSQQVMLGSWGASAVTMAFGEVPPALQTGVLDGLLTSLGGWNAVRNQAPYYTVAGINGIDGDYYWIGAAERWWNKLDKATQNAIQKIIVEDFIPTQKRLNWCNDQRVMKQMQVQDPSKPGIYELNADEVKVLADLVGSKGTDWLKKNTPADAHKWIDKFAEEARAASKAHPTGSTDIEKVNCADYEQHFPKKK
jgi:TRAP-type C4-dicarboxylate transport system substrate-binding protein